MTIANRVLCCASILVAAAGAASAADGASAAAPAAATAKPAPPLNVAILIFDGVQIIDYTGPYEVFGQARFNVFTVSAKGTPIKTAMGMSVTPAYSIENSPDPDVLVIPGGSVQATYEDTHVIDWIRARAATARNVMSVCNGAFILARTGLLDGLSATTFYGLIDEFRTFAPKVKVVTDQRFVDNGKIVTTAGLSSGIDGALHVIEKIRGKGKASAVAFNMEYDWRPDSGYARAAMADRRLPDIDLPDGVRLESVDAKGDRERFQSAWAVTGTMDAAGVLDFINADLAKRAGWKKGGATAGGDRRTAWSFNDPQGGTWAVETFLGAPAPGTEAPTMAFSIRKKDGTTAATAGSEARNAGGRG
jgi:putative intracellular protease/amidase